MLNTVQDIQKRGIELHSMESFQRGLILGLVAGFIIGNISCFFILTFLDWIKW